MRLQKRYAAQGSNPGLAAHPGLAAGLRRLVRYFTRSPNPSPDPPPNPDPNPGPDPNPNPN